MEGFQKTIRNRLILLTAGVLGACSAILLSARFEKAAASSASMQGFTEGFQCGIAASLLGVLFVFIVKYLVAARNPERMKRLYIAETDERKLYIRQQAGSVGMNVITYALAVGTCVAGNINDAVFLTLLGVCIFVVAVRGFLKLYYRHCV